MPGIRIPQGSRVIGASLAVGLNACLLLWVAIANGYPLLFFDSFSYLDSAHELELFIESGFRRLHDANAKLRWPGPSRSKPYELFLVTTRGNYWPWVPVAIASAAASWLLWLTVRHLRLQPATPWAVGIGLVLACLTSAPWVAGMLLPDALTAALIVAVALLATGAADGSKLAAFGLALVTAFAVAVHPSHIVLGAALAAAALALKLPISPWRRAIRPWLPIGAAIAGWSGLVLLGYVTLGSVSPTGTRDMLPFALSRFIADGPVRRYLANNCAREPWALCAYQDELTDDSDDLLFNPARPWWRKDDGYQLRRRIWAEQGPLLAATFRERGLEMAAAFLRNGASQLLATLPEVYSLTANFPGFASLPGEVTLVRRRTEILERAIQGLQGRPDAPAFVPVQLLQTTQLAAFASLAGMLLVPSLRARLASATHDRFMPFLLILIAGLAANAWITGGLSGVFSRYQARVAWLLPFVTLLALGLLWSGRPGKRSPIRGGEGR